MKKDKSHRSRKIEDHIDGEVDVIINTDTPGGTRDVSWEIKHGEVHSDPVFDSGSGKKVIVRAFDFRLPSMTDKPIKEELLDYHKKNTLPKILWEDQLVLAEEPRIMIRNKSWFTIFAICEPATRLGVRAFIEERPSLVHEILNDSRKTTN